MHTPITDPAMLADRLRSVTAPAAIGVDTEFLRERTYYAQLCLLQLSTGNDAFCVDTLALRSGTGASPDYTSLTAIMADDSVCKVLHAARQDLEVLWPHTGIVRNVFDTQLAAALAGAPAQIGYAALVEEHLQVRLHKTETRTDWSRRPLSTAQIEYALDDVRHLLPLRMLLSERLAKSGRTQWFAEDTQRAAEADNFQVDPEQAWRRIKGLGDLDEHRKRLAQVLAAWRERRAMSADRPRGWLLPDTALRDLVIRVPRSASDLAAISELPDGIRNNSGTQLLQLISDARVPQPAPPLPQRTRPEPEFVATVARLGDVTREVARELSVASEILATRRDMERIAAGERELLPLLGWRRKVIGERLLTQL
jgi:ribonuclease D